MNQKEMCGQCLISHNIIVYGRLTFIDSFLVIKNPRILWSRAIFGFPHRLISGYIIINNWKDIVINTVHWDGKCTVLTMNPFRCSDPGAVMNNHCLSTYSRWITLSITDDGCQSRNGTISYSQPAVKWMAPFPSWNASIHHFHLLCSKMEYVVVRQCIPITATIKPSSSF